MSANSFGDFFKLTSFGESHGPAIGGIVEGCPAGLSIDTGLIQQMLDRRKPGISAISSQRKEADQVELYSGLLEGKTLGTPIGFIIRNMDPKPGDYDMLRDTYRPSHADYTWDAKFGLRDYRGGGRSSARETASRVVAGAIALQLLNHSGITVTAWVSAVGEISLPPDHTPVTTSAVYANEVRCPDPETAARMIEFIKDIRSQGDTVGGMISCSVTGMPAGLGDPVFDKLNATLAHAMLSINAVKGFEIGSGFRAATMRGSQHNDPFVAGQGAIRTTTNHSGGIQGGISNGSDIEFRVAFKPVATVMRTQETITTRGEKTTLEPKGRHDPCVVPRAVPIVEAMTAITLADHLLRNRMSKL